MRAAAIQASIRWALGAVRRAGHPGAPASAARQMVSDASSTESV